MHIRLLYTIILADTVNLNYRNEIGVGFLFRSFIIGMKWELKFF